MQSKQLSLSDMANTIVERTRPHYTEVLFKMRSLERTVKLLDKSETYTPVEAEAIRLQSAALFDTLGAYLSTINKEIFG